MVLGEETDSVADPPGGVVLPGDRHLAEGLCSARGARIGLQGSGAGPAPATEIVRPDGPAERSSLAKEHLPVLRVAHFVYQRRAALSMAPDPRQGWTIRTGGGDPPEGGPRIPANPLSPPHPGRQATKVRTNVTWVAGARPAEPRPFGMMPPSGDAVPTGLPACLRPRSRWPTRPRSSTSCPPSSSPA